MIVNVFIYLELVFYIISRFLFFSLNEIREPILTLKVQFADALKK